MIDSALQLLTVGRVSVDLYCSDIGAGWSAARNFTKSVGGSPTNVAVACARLGHHSAVLTKVGADPLGDVVRSTLHALGVDTRFVATHPTLRTPLALATLDPPEDPQLLFYREPLAPDLTIEPNEVDCDVVRTVPVLWVTGTGMSAEPSASTTVALLTVRGRRQHTVVDLDWRPALWTSRAAASRGIGQLVDHATVAIGNRAECEVAVGTAQPDEAADRLLERGVAMAVIKLGGDGVLVATHDERTIVAPNPVEVVCGLGAGDAFGGALVHGLLLGWQPRAVVTFANAAGAIVASRLMCADAMPGAVEVLELLEAGHAAV